jgi:hypothetical protein
MLVLGTSNKIDLHDVILRGPRSGVANMQETCINARELTYCPAIVRFSPHLNMGQIIIGARVGRYNCEAASLTFPQKLINPTLTATEFLLDNLPCLVKK